MIIPLAIFAVTYLVLAIGKFPGLRMDRTGATVVGASAMVACGALTMEEAWAAIHSDTILLLFGMMIVVANLRLAGFFKLVAMWVLARTHSPFVLLAAVIAVSGFFSAFFVNDTMCLVLTPLVLEVTLLLEWNPVPYLLALATASNIGSVATITGNPQNMMIGSFSGIGYTDFLVHLAPVAIAGMVVAFGVIALLYRSEFRAAAPASIPMEKVRLHKPLLWKSLLATVVLIGFFFAGWPVSKVAMVAGAFLLVTRRVKPEKVYREIDFSLLVMFCGLFIVVAGMEKTPFGADLIDVGERLHLRQVPVLAAAAAVLSNLVSNVPAVLLFRPILEHLSQPRQAWLTLAMASTLAGNFTIVGSVANLIVVQRARSHAEIRFWDYFKAGAPITVLTLILGVLWLSYT